MSSLRTTRILRPGANGRRIKPHVLRRDGIVQPPSDVPRRDRYRHAVETGWRPLV